MSIGRNHPCPCGSGKKAKRCHESLIGASESGAAWYLDNLTFIEHQPGYVAPSLSAENLRSFRETGCPHGVCPYDTDYGGTCAATCGV